LRSRTRQIRDLAQLTHSRNLVSALSTSFKLAWSEPRSAFILEKPAKSLRRHEPRDLATTGNSGDRVKHFLTALFVALFLFPLAAIRRRPPPRTSSLHRFRLLRARRARHGLPGRRRPQDSPGFHVNAREVTFDYLIPTDLRADVPRLQLDNVIYPKGTLQTFVFSKDKS